MFIVIPGISLNRRLLNRDFTVFCVRGIRLSVQRLKELSVRQVTQELEDLSENIIGLVFIRLVMRFSHLIYGPDEHRLWRERYTVVKTCPNSIYQPRIGAYNSILAADSAPLYFFCSTIRFRAVRWR